MAMYFALVSVFFGTPIFFSRLRTPGILHVAHENEMAPRTCMPGHALFLGFVLGRIGDDDKRLLQLPIRREDFPQLIDRGLLSQESLSPHHAYRRLFADFLLQSGLRRKPCSPPWARVNHPVIAPASLMLLGMVRVERGGSKVVIVPPLSLTKPCAPPQA